MIRRNVVKQFSAVAIVMLHTGLACLAILAALVLAGCGNNSDQGGKAAPESGSHAAHDSGQSPAAKPKGDYYTCPMHPTVVSDRPGSCPICGMISKFWGR
jgi:hypothetical protein